MKIITKTVKEPGEDRAFPMKSKRLDISGKTSPYCLSVVEKEAKALSQSGELFITCDNFAAATTIIPRIAREEGLILESRKSSGNVWEIRLARDR
jgi:TusA-related sulfurtransferase